MGKFRDESQTVLAHMWHRVAKHSKNKRHQMAAHINSIEALTEPENLYQKVIFWIFSEAVKRKPSRLSRQ